MPAKKTPKHKLKKDIKQPVLRGKHSNGKIIIKVFAVFYFTLMILFISFHLYYANKIIPGVHVNGVDIGNKTPEEAINILIAELPETNKVMVRVGSDYAKEVKMESIKFHYLPVETAKYAFQVGREGPFIVGLINRGKSFFIDTHVDPKYSFDDVSLQSELSLIELQGLDPYQEPQFSLNEESGEIEIIPGKEGETFDKIIVSNQILEAYVAGEDRDIIVVPYKVNPRMTVDDLSFVKGEVKSLIDKSYSFNFDDYTWELSQEEELGMIEPELMGGDVTLRIDKPAVLKKLDEISQEIDRNPRGQVLEVEDGRAVRFVESKNGLRLLIKESAENVNNGFLNNFSDNVEIQLAVEVTTPPDSENQYGIDEILGIGTSKFKGSDSGRIHNIETATNKINGVMVPPGGVFSFGETVGEISRNTGFTSAWIISKGRTILGDGGGVCQVSTTVFRAALDAGLPIVERNAHSYRVGYYEQDSGPGIDATIYIPTVDLKFQNDTSGYILVSSELDKDNTFLKFTIYGQDDGRVVTITEPEVISRSSPPAARYIDNPNLAKGVTKQVEYPVSGAKVVFNRTVEKDGEVLYDDTFTSNYRAWGAVYEVGTKE